MTCRSVFTKRMSLLTLMFFIVFSVMPSAGYAAVACSDLGTADGFTCQDRADGIDVTTLRDVNLNLAQFNTADNSLNRLDLSLGNFRVNVTGGIETLIGGKFEIANGIMSVFNAAGVHVLSTADFKFDNASLMAVAGATNTITGKIDATGFVLNEGNFHGKGDVAFVGKAVENRGTIDLPLSHVYLGAGKVVTVGLSGDNLVSVVVDEEVEAGDEVLDFEGRKIKNQIENSGKITGSKVRLDAKGVGSVFEKAINLKGEIKAVDVGTNDKGEIVMLSMDDIYNNAILKASKITIDSDGTLTSRGSIEANEFREHAYTFKIGGKMKVGHAYFDNTDGAASIFEWAELEGVISDSGHLYVQSNFSLSGDLTIWADDDLNGTGEINWDFDVTATGNGHNLTLKASQNSNIGNISDVGTLTFQESAVGSNPVFISYVDTGDVSSWTNIADYRILSGQVSRFAGVGTAEDPYLIYNLNDLLFMSSMRSGYFQLENDINASATANWNQDAEVGLRGFRGGSLTNGGLTGGAGNGHTISNLFTSTGLFYSIAGSTVQNLTLTGLNLQGSAGSYGAVSSNATGGQQGHSQINNVHVTGSIIGDDSGGETGVGGLVGHASELSIADSSFEGVIEGRDKVGGLAGWINYSTITSSHAIVSVSGRTNVGGLVGFDDRNTDINLSYSRGTILGTTNVGGIYGKRGEASVNNQVYSSADVIGNTSVGGLIGWTNHGYGMTNVYATGNVTGFNNVGGLIGLDAGSNGAATSITNAYFSGAVSNYGNVTVNGLIGNMSAGGGLNASYSSVYWRDTARSTGLYALYDSVDGGSASPGNIHHLTSSAESQNQVTYQGFDFGGTWAIDSTSQTPYLQALGRHPLSNAGTPAANPNSSLVRDVLNKSNYDRNIIPRDIFNNSVRITDLGVVGGGDARFNFGSHDNFSDPSISNAADFLRQLFEGFQNGGNFKSNVIQGGDRFNFDVGADQLNLPEAMAIEDLFKSVFENAAVQPAENRPALNSTGTVVGNVSGDVRVVSTNGEVYQVTQGMVLAEGDRVLTGEGASVDLKVDGESKSVTLKEKTVVGVATKEDAAANQPAQSLLMLAFGQMSANLKGASASSSFEVQTPVGVSGMRG